MSEPNSTNTPFRSGETTITWVPRPADPTRPTAKEIAAGTALGLVSGSPDLTFTHDDNAITDPGVILKPPVERRLVRRWRLDATHELVQITALAAPDDSGPRDGCEHQRPTRVETETGDLVGHLCLACETWLPPEWTA